ncbi:MAG: Glycosyl transferase group 1 [Parcubacteria group bacterium GW2011_GWB1_41_4]|nr:MAG: Glycosyl transferase group 1 [Parcubacteria group bacterium GW2011_GWB1_41_4]
MKKVLFIGVTKYNLEKDAHLRKKFEGLSRGIKPYILAKGKITMGKKIFGAEFYLLPPSPFFWIPAISLGFWLCLVKKIDVIVAQSPLMEGLAGTILKKIFRKELIVEIHGDWEVRKNLSKLAKIGLRNADKIRGVAQYLVAKAKKFAPDKPYFIFPTFTDLDEFLGERDINFGNTVLLVGRNDPVKGVKYLVEACAKIKKEFPDFKLSLVGEGLPEGKLSLEEVKRRMKNCYCLVVPSLSEGLPRVILEAQALGKPVIASKVGGIPELITDGRNGFLFKVGDSNELAEKLRTLLNNKELAIEMGRRGRDLVGENFSNEKYLENYIQMINS